MRDAYVRSESHPKFVVNRDVRAPDILAYQQTLGLLHKTHLRGIVCDGFLQFLGSYFFFVIFLPYETHIRAIVHAFLISFCFFLLYFYHPRRTIARTVYLLRNLYIRYVD
jgi:uncharacterized BrkB/YihY/UPF0761 family membrane protein